MATDKYYWHDYTDYYQQYVFANITPNRILEFGVDKGDSMIYFSEAFPEAQIVGVDVNLGDRALLPSLKNVTYVQLDQRNHHDVKGLLQNYTGFDLIVDDASHEPKDQAGSLITCFPFLNPSGYYIIEDIHTNSATEANPLRVLLAIEHIRKMSMMNKLTRDDFAKLASHTYFTVDEVIYLCNNISYLRMIRRSSLPRCCWNCKESNFDYIKLQCLKCATQLFAMWDSMSFILRKA